jgi:hypothetical protein
MSLVRCERISTSRGKTWLKAGISKTSSNVRPSPNNLDCADLLRGEVFLVAMCKDSVADKFLPKLFIE